MNKHYQLRPFKLEDLNFIRATFLRGLYYGDSWFSTMPKDAFMENYSKVVDALVASPNALVVVACLPDDPDVILGYSICSLDGESIHWVFIKKAWRQQGIGKDLLPPSPKYVTHLSALGKSLLSKINCSFNPFKLG